MNKGSASANLPHAELLFLQERAASSFQQGMLAVLDVRSASFPARHTCLSKHAACLSLPCSQIVQPLGVSILPALPRQSGCPHILQLMTYISYLLPLQGRKAILEVHSRNKKIGEDVDMFAVAQATAGYTGAELMNLMNKAAILAVRQGREVIKAIDIYEVGMRGDCSLRSFGSLTHGLAGSL